MFPPMNEEIIANGSGKVNRHYYNVKNVEIEHYYVVFFENMSYTINIKG